ncbi:MAG: FkbM family methyltransferase [Spirochaetes bacterium]|nr:FkbM family methyltransferase [Spirochaetota bacterium]
MDTFFRSILQRIHSASMPLLSRIPVRLWRGPAAGLISVGALAYTDIFRDESPAERFLDELTLAGKTVYDIGGYIGITGIAFARKTGEKGNVICCEPNPVLVRLIRKNKRSNKMYWLEIMNIAVGEADGQAEMYVEPDRAAAGTLRKNAAANSKFAVTVRTVDSLVKEGVPAPDLVAVDAPGYGLQVLKGMTTVLRKGNCALIIALYDNDTAAVISLLMKYGYSIRHIEQAAMITDAAAAASLRSGHIYCTKNGN